jgi:hypothetical protein
MVDLGYVFHEMNDSSGFKSTLVTQHPGIIPESHNKYITRRKEWIELLFKSKDHSSQQEITPSDLTQDLKPGRITSVYPNPSKGNFAVDFILDRKGLISLSILSPSGQIMAEIQKGIMEQGEYHEMISGPKLPAGIYYIRLCFDNVITDAGKLIILK